MAVEKKIKFPKTMGALADMLYKNKLELATAKKAHTKLDDERKAIIAHVIATFPKQDLDGALGKLGKLEIKSKDRPQIDDREKFNKYIAKHGAFDMLQARVSDKAITDRIDDGVKMSTMGIKMFNTVTVSCTKR